MNSRERIIRTVRFQEVDQLPMRHAYGLMPFVLEDWHDQGLPRSVQSPDDIYDYFGFARKPAPLPLQASSISSSDPGTSASAGWWSAMTCLSSRWTRTAARGS